MLLQTSSHSSVELTPAYLLRKGQEIDCFNGKIQRRCVIVQYPSHEGNRVRLVVAPASSPWPSKWAVVVFGKDTLFSVYPMPYVKATAAQVLDRTIQSVLDLLTPYDGPLTARQIADRLRLAKPTVGYSKPRVLEACRELVRRRVLLECSPQGSGTATFRLPLPKDPGFPVVELRGKRSERVGWIVAWKEVGEVEYPVVRWLAPGYFCSLSSEDLLEPLINRFQIQQVELAKQRLGGFGSSSPIPEALLYQLCAARAEGRILSNNPVLLEIAIVLGVIGAAARHLDYRQRNAVLETIDLHHPNWRKGDFR